jgi:hypothetical protein
MNDPATLAWAARDRGSEELLSLLPTRLLPNGCRVSVVRSSSGANDRYSGPGSIVGLEMPIGLASLMEIR